MNFYNFTAFVGYELRPTNADFFEQCIDLEDFFFFNKEEIKPNKIGRKIEMLKIERKDYTSFLIGYFDFITHDSFVLKDELINVNIYYFNEEEYLFELLEKNNFKNFVEPLKQSAIIEAVLII